MNGQRSQLWTSDYCRVLLAHLLLLLTGNLLASSFSLYLFFRGGTDMTIGVLHYLNAFGALLMRPFAGWYLDHRSRRSLLMFCLVGLVCLPFGYIFASSMALIALDRLLTSLLSAVATTGVTTNAYDTLNEGNFNEGVGYLGFCNSLANAIGPGLGLWLWEKHNVWGLFGAVAVASLLALLLLRKFNFREIPKEHITPFRQESFRNLLYEKKCPARLNIGSDHRLGERCYQPVFDTVPHPTRRNESAGSVLYLSGLRHIYLAAFRWKDQRPLGRGSSGLLQRPVFYFGGFRRQLCGEPDPCLHGRGAYGLWLWICGDRFPDHVCSDSPA